MENNIDITELLTEYVDLLEKGGISKTSTESKIMLNACKEIQNLREQVINCKDLHEETCKMVRDESVETYVCGMCRFDCDHGLDGYANECPGFEKNDCFELDVDKYNKIIFRRKQKMTNYEKYKDEIIKALFVIVMLG